MKLRLALLLSAITLHASAQNKLAGNWQGSISAGGKTVRIVMHVTEAGGKLSATMDSPDQGVTGIPCAGIKLSADTVRVDMSNIGVTYDGLLKDDNNITGAWHQGGGVIPLDLAKTDKPAEMSRPQTPKPPFDYQSEDVTFSNKDKSIQYGATITMPKDGAKHPAVLLISGSGPQNRDEELLGHKPFAVIADYLTKKGYIVLRVDDRGVGQTTGDRKKSTSADFAQDANAAIDYLLTRKEVNTRKIGMLGHSEGGLIAPMVATQRKDINFIILMAGPGIKIQQLMEEQNAAMLKTSGVTDTVIKEYIKLYHDLTGAIMTSATGVDAKNKMITILNSWKATASADAMAFTGLNGQDRNAEFIDGFMEIYHDTWFNYFLKVDPQPNLQKLSCKVLAINGDKDVQVVSKSNLEGIRQMLAKSKTKNYEVKELPGLNHLFQTCKTCSAQEYGALEETIAPAALQAMGDWMDKNVK